MMIRIKWDISVIDIRLKIEVAAIDMLETIKIHINYKTSKISKNNITISTDIKNDS